MGRNKIGVRRYDSLLERNLPMAQKNELALQFELSSQSWLAASTVQKFNQEMDAFESETGLVRVKPGHLLISYHNHLIHIPLITENWANLIAKEHKFSDHQQRVLECALNHFRMVDPKATTEDVYQYLNRRAFLPRWEEGGCKRTRMPDSGQIINPEKVNASPPKRISPSEVIIPSTVMESLLSYLVKEAGVGPSNAMAMIQFLAARRESYCPLESSLNPGQAVWLALSSTKYKPPHVQFARRVVFPIILTVFTEEEFKRPIQSLKELNQLNMEQCARVLVEAYLQNTLIPQIELELLFLRSNSVLEDLLRNYMKIHGVILPTPGTILDAGRAMTHKNIIVAESVAGLFTSEIAQKTYHAPESVDAYLKVFQSVLILYLYDMPVSLMARVTGRGQSLIEEYILLVKEHFPDRDAIISYLKEQELEIV
jgi:hypothetical protein